MIFPLSTAYNVKTPGKVTWVQLSYDAMDDGERFVVEGAGVSLFLPLPHE